MAFQFASRTRRKARRYQLQKPRGVIHPRVQAVGPEHFGFLRVDCAKARSEIMLADFYGRDLIQPTTATHDRFALDALLRRRKAAMHLRVGNLRRRDALPIGWFRLWNGDRNSAPTEPTRRRRSQSWVK